MLRSFVYTTLFAATLASAALTVDTTGPTAQCGELSVSWKGNSGAVDVYLFPGCDEEEEDAVFELLDVSSGSTQIPLPYKAGTTWKVEVYDSQNNTDSSDEFTLTGDWKEFKDCSKEQIAEISSSSVVATSTATATADADGSAPTTQAASTTRGVVNNAAAGGSSSASAASATQSTNGASALMSKPFGFTAGIVLAVSVALSL